MTMTLTKDAATEFLALKRVAVTGVSANPKGHGSNAVYAACASAATRCSRSTRTSRIAEGDATFPNLPSIPGGVEAVVIGTRPDRAEATMREAIDLGVLDVWMHRSLARGSVSESRTPSLGRENGVTVIDGGCPLMYGPTSDGGHRVMCKAVHPDRQGAQAGLTARPARAWPSAPPALLPDPHVDPDRRADEPELLAQPPLDEAPVARLEEAGREQHERGRPRRGLRPEQDARLLAAAHRVRMGCRQAP